MSKEQSPGKPTTRRYSPEDKAAAVRMARALRAELGTEQGTVARVARVARQLGYGVESVRSWVRQADIDEGLAPGVSTAESARIEELEQEARELERANEILNVRPVSSGRSSTANTRASRLHRRKPRRIRGRAHLHRAAERRVSMAPSTYYDTKSRPPSARARRDAVLTPVLVGLWKDNYRVYGARKLWKTARREVTREILKSGVRPYNRCRFSLSTASSDTLDLGV